MQVLSQFFMPTFLAFSVNTVMDSYLTKIIVMVIRYEVNQ